MKQRILNSQHIAALVSVYQKERLQELAAADSRSLSSYLNTLIVKHLEALDNG